MAGGLGKAKGKLDNVLSRSQVIEHYQGREEKRPSDSVVSRKRGGLFVGGGDGRCVWGGRSSHFTRQKVGKTKCCSIRQSILIDN